MEKGIMGIGKTLLLTLALLLTNNACGREKLPDTDSSNNTNELVSATLDVSSRPLAETFMCFNVNSLRVQSWQREKFQQAVKNLNPSMLRIPGGAVGNYWDWQKGGLIDDTSNLAEGLPRFMRGSLKYQASALPNYQEGLEATETAPLFVVNMLTDDLPSQMEMLRTARDLGMAIKYVELGNEFYFNIPNYRQGFATPKDYADMAAEWTKEIKKEFPEAEIAVLGVVPPPDKPTRLQTWNSSLLDAGLPEADAITLHIYEDHGLDQTQITRQEYPFFDETEIPIILGQPFHHWQQLTEDKNYQLIPKNKKIWFTEYNLMEDIFGKNRGTKPRVLGSWLHGLYNLTTSLLFLEDSRTEIICNHDLVSNYVFGAILANKNSFPNPDTGVSEAVPLSLSATGSTLEMLGSATKGMNKANKISFTNNSSLTGKDNLTYPALYGWMFSNATDEQAIIVNLSSENKQLHLQSLFREPASYEQLHGYPWDLVDKKGILVENSGVVTDKIDLPAYSVTKFSTILSDPESEE